MREVSGPPRKPLLLHVFLLPPAPSHSLLFLDSGCSLPRATCSTRVKLNGGLYRGAHWQRVMDVLELTGPYALGRVVDAHVQRNPSARIALLSDLRVFATSRSTASWMGHLKPT